MMQMLSYPVIKREIKLIIVTLLFCEALTCSCITHSECTHMRRKICKILLITFYEREINRRRNICYVAPSWKNMRTSLVFLNLAMFLFHICIFLLCIFFWWLRNGALSQSFLFNFFLSCHREQKQIIKNNNKPESDKVRAHSPVKCCW